MDNTTKSEDVTINIKKEDYNKIRDELVNKKKLENHIALYEQALEKYKQDKKENSSQRSVFKKSSSETEHTGFKKNNNTNDTQLDITNNQNTTNVIPNSDKKIHVKSASSNTENTSEESASSSESDSYSESTDNCSENENMYETLHSESEIKKAYSCLKNEMNVLGKKMKEFLRNDKEIHKNDIARINFIMYGLNTLDKLKKKYNA